MGVFLLLKLESLPIVDTDKIESAFLSLASVDVELQVLSRMATDYKTHRKYFKEYRSSAEIYAYATEQIQSGNMMLGRFTWKMVWPCLVLYGGVRGFIRYASPPSAYVCIIRAGPSTWLTCDFSAMEQDIKDSSETQVEPRSPIRSEAKPKAKTKRKVRPKREYACVVSANGKYYHRPNCRLVKNIRDENLIGFYSTSEPKALGFERCSKCKPFQTKTKPKAKRKNVYWGSATGQCFHRLKCQLVKGIKKEDLIVFGSIEEAKGFGYKKCRRCNP